MLDNKEEDLERLAELCLSTAKQIKEHLASTGHPQMTFDQNGPQFFPQDSSPMEIQLARLNLRAASKRLYDLVSGPDEVIVWNTYDIVSLLLSSSVPFLGLSHEGGSALMVALIASFSGIIRAQTTTRVARMATPTCEPPQRALLDRLMDG